MSSSIRIQSQLSLTSKLLFLLDQLILRKNKQTEELRIWGQNRANRKKTQYKIWVCPSLKSFEYFYAYILFRLQEVSLSEDPSDM